jgi:hypothetical protein
MTKYAKDSYFEDIPKGVFFINVDRFTIPGMGTTQNQIILLGGLIVSSGSRKVAVVKKKYPENYYSSIKEGVIMKKPDPKKPDITTLDINEIKRCGLFTPAERAAEFRRRGKSPSGVIDGVYNDAYRGNDEYNDAYRDWEADA